MDLGQGSSECSKRLEILLPRLFIDCRHGLIQILSPTPSNVLSLYEIASKLQESKVFHRVCLSSSSSYMPSLLKI